MTEFHIDTSGTVPFGGNAYTPACNMTWERLGRTRNGPFVQGSIEALFAGVDGFAVIDLDRPGQYRFRGFRDLSSEALDRIIADCERAMVGRPWPNTAEAGREFWRSQQSGRHSLHPPLTPTLSDDGKVYLRDA